MIVRTTQPGLDLEMIAARLAKHHPERRPVHDRGHAAVAMLLKEGCRSPEVLFIIRAEHEQDPWSGNIGFPGGRLNPAGESPRQATEREVYEELSIELQQAQYLGQLNDLYGAVMPVLVSCFVYQVEEPLRLQPNYEIAKVFWCPLSTLLEPQRHQQRVFTYQGAERAHPVIDLLDGQEPFLWGITYRLVRDFFKLCGQDFGGYDPAKCRKG